MIYAFRRTINATAVARIPYTAAARSVFHLNKQFPRERKPRVCKLLTRTRVSIIEEHVAEFSAPPSAAGRSLARSGIKDSSRGKYQSRRGACVGILATQVATRSSGKIKQPVQRVLFDSSSPVSRSGRFRAKTDQPRLGFANAAANKHCGRNDGGQ